MLNALEQALGPMLASGVVAFVLVGLAEIGDKSQLVCMSLAARYRPWPVLAGAVVGFAGLNALAVVFGAAAAAWLPGWLIGLVVAGLFLAFGLHALLQGYNPEPTSGEPSTTPGTRSVFLGTLGIIFVAEFGDKTQIATAGLGAAGSPAAVWTGATLGMTVIAGLAIIAGSTILRRLPLKTLHRLSGVLFLALAVMALISVWMTGEAA